MDRVADHAIDPVYIERWSSRAFSSDTLTFEELAPMFEAARWAPSAFNRQPWRFAVAVRGDQYWEDFVGCLLPFNAVWASKAAALIILSSDKFTTMPGKDEPVRSSSHSFDAGAAWGYLALEATRLGLVSHAMAGFDRSKAATVSGLGDTLQPEVIIAVGYRGNPEDLPEALRARELPSPRKPINATVFHGPISATVPAQE